MSSPYDSSRRRRGAWSQWVPLAVTATVATVGVAAWLWSRAVENEDHERHLDYENADNYYGGTAATHGARARGHGEHDNGPNSSSRDRAGSYTAAEARAEAEANAGWGHQVTGALRRTPSPQQFLSHAGRTVAAGVGAVGAAMGSALAAIREEDKDAYKDHETWSQEAEARRESSSRPSAASTSRDSNRRRKTVAVVVSADVNMDELDEGVFLEHASILSHIPRTTDLTRIKLVILIYAPGLSETALEPAASQQTPGSLSSSFSNIGHSQAQSPEEGKSSPLRSRADRAFRGVYDEALTLVEKESMVLPFTSANGHVHILRHLQPEVIYLQESLAGDEGIYITHLQTWLRHDVILVVGADDGGIADSDTESAEAEKPARAVEWWQREDRVGRGRGVVVVDGLGVGVDWTRRVQGIVE